MNRIIQYIDGTIREQSIDGTIREMISPVDIKGMRIPVRCNHCGRVYDLTDVKVIHRYQDCTSYETPCCKRKADDREWKSFKDFERIDPSIIEKFTRK